MIEKLRMFCIGGLAPLALFPIGDGGDTGGGGVVVDTATDNVFFTNSRDNTVSVVSGATDEVISTVAAGTNPFGAAADPVTRQVYIGNRDSHDLTVIRDTFTLPSTPTPTATATPSNAPASTNTLTITPTRTPTATGTPTNSPTASSTPTRTTTATDTPTNTPTDVEDHVVRCHGRGVLYVRLGARGKLLRHHHVGGDRDVHAASVRLLHEAPRDVHHVGLVQRLADRETGRGQERVGDPAADDQLVHPGEQRLEDGQLRGDLRARHDRDERPRRLLEGGLERHELVDEQRPGTGHRREPRHAVSARLGAVRRAEGVHDEGVAEGGHAPREFLGVLLLPLVEAHVLEQDRLARRDSTPPSQSCTSGTFRPSSSASRCATGSSDSAGSNSPSFGRPRWDIRMTRAPRSRGQVRDPAGRPVCRRGDHGRGACGHARSHGADATGLRLRGHRAGRPCHRATSGPAREGTRISVPGDFSSAAFFIVAACIGPRAPFTIGGVGVNPTRTGLLEMLALMGADLRLVNHRTCGAEPVADIEVRPAPLRGIRVPQRLVPLAIDEFPAFFIAAACAEGETVVTGAEELRVKESDRIAVMGRGLEALGVRNEVLPALVPHGGAPLYDLLGAVDAVLTFHSSVGLEGMLFDRPIVSLEPFGEENPLSYGREGAAAVARTAEDLARALSDDVPSGPDAPARRAARERYLRDNLQAVGEKSAARVRALIRALALRGNP